MVMEFIMRIQQSDGSKCYNRISENFCTEVLIPLRGLSSEAAITLLFGYCLDSCDVQDV